MDRTAHDQIKRGIFQSPIHRGLEWPNVRLRNVTEKLLRRDCVIFTTGRLLHHNDLEKGRPEDWGVRQEHSLYQVWCTLRRRTIKVDKRWRDFWRFVGDVEPRPSDKHILCRSDESLAIGPENFFWREKVVLKENDEDYKQYQARYQRAYRQVHQERVRNSELKKHYGITLDQYNAMFADQKGLCAICGREERAFEKRYNRLRRLEVDHCHETGKVRGLLCTHCNQSIGNLNHDVELLRKAITYLEHYA